EPAVRLSRSSFEFNSILFGFAEHGTSQNGVLLYLFFLARTLRERRFRAAHATCGLALRAAMRLVGGPSATALICRRWGAPTFGATPHSEFLGLRSRARRDRTRRGIRPQNRYRAASPTK